MPSVEVTSAGVGSGVDTPASAIDLPSLKA